MTDTCLNNRKVVSRIHVMFQKMQLFFMNEFQAYTPFWADWSSSAKDYLAETIW